jgi:hypothetical protein
MESDVFFQENLGKSWDFMIFIQKKKGFEVTEKSEKHWRKFGIL